MLPGLTTNRSGVAGSNLQFEAGSGAVFVS
jgi:hypothetical protein